MSLAQRSRREVQRRLARLRDTYGEFPVEEQTVENDPSYFEHGSEYIESGHVGAAGALVRSENGVLLVYHSGGEQWGTPGGGHEPGESLAETAQREIREETATTCRLVDVFYAERKRFVHRDDPERRGYLLEVIFEAEHVSGSPDASEDEEIQAADWFEEPPAPLYDPVAPGTGAWEFEN
jgi:8-oxo-dGTP diphosphatase